MFWLSKKKQKELIELEQKVQRLRSEEQDLLASIRRLKEEQTRELTTAVEHFQFSLDFDRMDAFSVERVISDGKVPKTNIGYFVGGSVKEWYLQTSAKEHNRIVAEFELWKGKRK